MKKVLMARFSGKSLLLAVLSVVLGASYWIFFVPSYYFVIPVQIDSKWNAALIQMEIANKKYKVEFDLGARLSALSPMDLNKIDKNFSETLSNFDMHGNIYERAVYQVSGVKIHDFFLPKMKILEESPDFLANTVLKGNKDELPYTGRIGREVFEGKNFLLDFPQSKIIVCKSFKDLAKNGYKSEDFTKAPFFISNKSGICFPVETDTGIKILLLDSGSSISFVRSSAEEENLSTETWNDFPVWCSKKFILGGHDFGEMEFYLFKISSLFSDINGILGMDFLQEHAIYLDIERSEAYIEKTPTTLREEAI